MGSGMPPPPNYRGAADETAAAGRDALNSQTQANRPTQSSPYATTGWTQGPDGQWHQSTSFNGALGGLNESLQQQAASAMGSPLDFSKLPGLTTGDAAREQAINSAYGSATSRLDPAFQQREEGLRTQLLNQGLSEGSEAYERAMGSFGRERNDAYSQALSGAIGQGTAAGQAIYNQSLSTRQNAMSEALRQRGQAFSELQGMQGLTQQAGFNSAGLAQSPDYLGVEQMNNQDAWQRYQARQQQIQDWISGGTKLLGAGLGFL